MHWVQEVREEYNVGIGPELVEELAAGLQDRSEQIPGVIGRQRDEKKVEAVEHLAASQDVAESHVAKDADRRDDGLQNALNPGETVALIY